MGLTWGERAAFAGEIARYAARNPGRVPDVVRFGRERHASPFDLRRPWWPYPALGHVAGLLPTGARVLEFGGGGSTLWLQDLGAQVVTVEHHEGWAGHLRETVAGADVRLVPPAPTGTVTSRSDPGFFDDYVAVVDEFADASLDLVVVDGRARVDCALRSLPKVRPGGALLLDDSDRPRYAGVHHEVTWPGLHFRGLKPGAARVARTTVWVRPG